MKLFIQRALKYAIRMIVILAVVFLIMWLLGGFNTSGGTVLHTLFSSWKGWVLIGLLVLLAIMYPTNSFGTISVKGNMNDRREDVISAFNAYKYSLIREKEGEMVFRADSIGRKLMEGFNDTVTVTQEGSFIQVEGLKKVISRVQVRLNVFLKN